METIIPGHGPITDKAGVQRVKDYLLYAHDEARKRYDAGLSVTDTAFDISLTDYAAWSDAERIVVNVNTLYREFRGDTSPPNVTELFGLMGKLKRDRNL